MANIFENISAACDSLMESARNLAESAENMRKAAAIRRENVARLDAVRKRLREARSINREIVRRLDIAMKECEATRKAMERNLAAFPHPTEATYRPVEQPPTPPRSAIGLRQLADADWVSEPASPLDLRTWQPEGDPH